MNGICGSVAENSYTFFMTCINEQHWDGKDIISSRNNRSERLYIAGFLYKYELKKPTRMLMK